MMTTPRAIIVAAVILGAALWFGPNRYQYSVVGEANVLTIVRGHTATGRACVLVPASVKWHLENGDKPGLARGLPADAKGPLPLCDR